MKPETKQRILRWGGTAIALAAAAFFVAYLLRHLDSAPAITWSATSVAVLAGAVAVYTAVYALVGVAWVVLLRSSGEAAAFRDGVSITLVSQIAKYLPGNVAHHIGRAGMGRLAGWSGARTVATMMVEIAWLVLAGALLAFAGLATRGGELVAALPEAPSLATVALIAAGALAAPAVALWLLNRWRPGPLRTLLGEETVRLPGIGAATAVLGLYLTFFFGNALILDLFGRVLFSGEGHFLLLAGIFGIGWLVGFVTPGAPAGLGIRDLILATAMAPLYGPGIAAAIAALHRLCAVLGDGAQFLCGLMLARRRLRTTANVGMTAE